MPWRSMKALAKSFELSSWAASWVGPKMRRPAARKASTTPAASGASGPTTVKAMFCSRANTTSSGMLLSATLLRRGSWAVPALPGATNTWPARGDWAMRQASACSRPPEPMTRIFMVYPCGRVESMAEVAHAGQHHGDAVLVGGGEHFFVAHRAPRMDDGLDALFGDHVDAVAE